MSLVLLGLPTIAAAGPWARDAGEVWAKAGVGHFAGRLTSDTVEVYGEIGLGNAVELDASGLWAVQRADGGTTSGVQDLELLAEWAPVSGSTAVALVGGLRVAPYRRGRTPELGPGGADVLLGAGWGTSFGSGWGVVDALYRHRLGTSSAGLRLRTEWGLGGATAAVALTAEVQPATGRSTDLPPRGPAPVPRTLGVGAKGLLHVWHGIGLIGDVVWMPRLFNDGPGVRVGAGITYAASPARARSTRRRSGPTGP